MVRNEIPDLLRPKIVSTNKFKISVIIHLKDVGKIFYRKINIRLNPWGHINIVVPRFCFKIGIRDNIGLWDGGEKCLTLKIFIKQSHQLLL